MIKKVSFMNRYFKNISLMNAMLFACSLVFSEFIIAHPGDHFAPRQAGTIADDGKIISQQPYQFEYQNYKQFVQEKQQLGMSAKKIKEWLSEEHFNEYQRNSRVVATELVYRSAGTNIAGFMFVPKDAAVDKLPVIIYNHDGYLRNASINFSEIIELYRLAEQGYVVLASYFRGNGTSEGRADFTIGDVTDAYNLTMLARKNIPFADTSKVGILGLGRGATTAYHMALHNDTYDAAVMMGAPVDFTNSHRLYDLDKNVFPYAVRHYKEDRKSALKRISPLKQVQHLNRKLPILLMHGAQDNDVLVADTLNMATALNKQSQVYRLAIFEETDHQLSQEIVKVRQEIDYWFHKYLK